MPRKAVLEGGKRDEIIDAAMELFFENGYEATSVRMIMDKVGGEIGMFYHYFKSKDMLFDNVAEKFFRDCGNRFGEMIASCTDVRGFVDEFLPAYSAAMARFDRLKDNMHWTIQVSLNAKTILSMVPSAVIMIQKWDIDSRTPTDILARQLIFGISATIHSPGFALLDDGAQKECVMDYINKVLYK